MSASAATLPPRRADEDIAVLPASADGCTPQVLAAGAGGPTLVDGVQQVLNQCRERVLGRILRANDLTSAEVLSVGATLSEVAACAQAQVATTRDALSGTSGNGSVTALIDEQSAMTQAHVEGLCLALAEQAKLARNAMTASASIAAIGAQVSNVASQTRLLSLNANIEAARLGHTGGAFQVIATEMRRLTSEIEQANRRVAEMADALVTLLPQIVGCADDLSARANVMNNDLSASRLRVRGATGELRNVVTSILDNGDQTSRRILASTYDAISHLQFQDPTAQGLLLIDADLAALVEHVGALVTQAGASAAPLPEGVDLNLRTSRSHAERHVGAVQVLEDGPAAQAGEMLLF